MTETASKLLKWGLLLTACFSIFPYWQAWVTHRLWTWFVVPLGAPPITVAHAFALTVLVALVAPQPPTPPEDADSDKVFNRTLALGVLRPALALFLGQLARTVLA